MCLWQHRKLFLGNNGTKNTLTPCTQTLISTKSKMASLANHAHNAAPTSSLARGHDPGTQAPIAPMVHTKKVLNRVREKDVRDALAKRLGRETIWGCPAGFIDVITKSEVVEIKHYYIHELSSMRRSQSRGNASGPYICVMHPIFRRL